MINIEKIKRKKGKVHPPPPSSPTSPFKKTCPCTILSPQKEFGPNYALQDGMEAFSQLALLFYQKIFR